MRKFDNFCANLDVLSRAPEQDLSNEFACLLGSRVPAGVRPSVTGIWGGRHGSQALPARHTIASKALCMS